MPDDLTPDAFARLSALEQSQELLRRAEVLNASSLTRHEQILARHEQDLVLHGQCRAHWDAAHAEHAARLARLDDIAAKIQLTLDAVLEMLRNRNGQ